VGGSSCNFKLRPISHGEERDGRGISCLLPHRVGNANDKMVGGSECDGARAKTTSIFRDLSMREVQIANEDHQDRRPKSVVLPDSQIGVA